MSLNAGSMSVSMHMVSPLSEGLFKRAIMQSGSMAGLPFFAPPVQPQAQMLKLANALGN